MILKIALYGGAILIAAVVIVMLIGYALPQGHVATVTAELPVPPARVFERISDPARYGEWRPGVSKIEMLATSPVKWREEAGGDTITFEVVESRAPEKFAVRIADPDLPFGGTWTYELAPAGSATQLRITERGEVYNPIFRFMSRFVISQTATMEKFVAALRESFRDGGSA